MFTLDGWIELDGHRLPPEAIESILGAGAGDLSRCGGEFLLKWSGYCARDWLGIVPGPCPPGTVLKDGRLCGYIHPAATGSELFDGDRALSKQTVLDGIDAAIRTAVALRADEGVVTAFSGGVDSAFVAKLADLPCVAIGLEGSHDLTEARNAANSMGLSCECIVFSVREVEQALITVIRDLYDIAKSTPPDDLPGFGTGYADGSCAIEEMESRADAGTCGSGKEIPCPVIRRSPSPVDVAVGAAQYCIARWAREQGYRRILSGQGADELFGGYAKYLTTSDPERSMGLDFAALLRQVHRDQVLVAPSGARFSFPYLDVRVVRVAGRIPAAEKIFPTRKHPLREVALRHVPAGIAWKEKKAMQYGSGFAKVLANMARHNGYKRSVQRYIDYTGGR
ncbi:MAG: asparagine synthase C-terminal domain-containing protein [Methanoregulaceae archaeon]|nr:asparagine synthase C-terminal domain-containing protein [Methanoregulaceae archaeon]